MRELKPLTSSTTTQRGSHDQRRTDSATRPGPGGAARSERVTQSTASNTPRTGHPSRGLHRYFGKERLDCPRVFVDRRFNRSLRAFPRQVARMASTSSTVRPAIAAHHLIDSSSGQSDVKTDVARKNDCSRLRWATTSSQSDADISLALLSIRRSGRRLNIGRVAGFGNDLGTNRHALIADRHVRRSRDDMSNIVLGSIAEIADPFRKSDLHAPSFRSGTPPGGCTSSMTGTTSPSLITSGGTPSRGFGYMRGARSWGVLRQPVFSASQRARVGGKRLRHLLIAQERSPSIFATALSPPSMSMASPTAAGVALGSLSSSMTSRYYLK